MVYVLLFAAELVLGAIVGFILSDNRKGLSTEEVKISSILFLISTAFVFSQDTSMSGLTYAHLAFSWLLLILGVILGEVIKIRLINKIVSSIRKKDIQIAINELVSCASQLQNARRQEDTDGLYKKLYEVQNMLNALAHKSRKTQDKDFLHKLHYLFELCEDYVSISVRLRDNCSAPEQRLNDTWLSIGNELTGLSWDTLNHAEENVKKELGKAFSMKAVKESLNL